MIVFRTAARDTLNPVKALTMNLRPSPPDNSSPVFRLQEAVALLSRSMNQARACNQVLAPFDLSGL
jgi:hypothetical protein